MFIGFGSLNDKITDEFYRIYDNLKKFDIIRHKISKKEGLTWSVKEEMCYMFGGWDGAN